MFQEFQKAAIDERERSIQELLRERRLANARQPDARWRSTPRTTTRQPNGQRGL